MRIRAALWTLGAFGLLSAAEACEDSSTTIEACGESTYLEGRT